MPKPLIKPPKPPDDAFEKRVLHQLNRIEEKIDLLTSKVDECCEEEEEPRPTGVRISQIM